MRNIRTLAAPRSRRGFLTTLAATGAAIATSSVAKAQSPAQSSNVGRFLTIDGNRVWVEERGQGIPIVMSAGGQNRVETMRPLAEKLAAKYRVITWDRANMGRSDLVLKGSRDVDIWTDQQAGIMYQLKARPGYLIGASSGGRTAYSMALRYPDYARGVFTYLTTGGGTIGESLAKQYYFDYADLAEKSGMEAVAKTPFWAERIKLNPANEQKLLSMDPHDFAALMRRFGKAMRSSDVVIGITADELRQIKANGTPVAITQGCAEAPQHRRDRSEQYAELTGATLIPTPEHYCTEANSGATYEKQILHPEVPESIPFRAYEMLADIPALIEDFITKTEAQYKAAGLGPEATRYTPEPKKGPVGPAYKP